jgi:hypothetical protein
MNVPDRADVPDQANLPADVALRSEPETVYDATDVQIKAVEEIVKERLRIADLTSPEVVQVILQREMVSLTDLKASKKEISELRKSNSELLSDRENLRIELAKSGQRESVSWIEIPIGVLSGFAINILTGNFRDGLGWVLLIMSLVILLFLRMPQLKQVLGGRR